MRQYFLQRPHRSSWKTSDRIVGAKDLECLVKGIDGEMAQQKSDVLFVVISLADPQGKTFHFEHVSGVSHEGTQVVELEEPLERTGVAQVTLDCVVQPGIRDASARGDSKSGVEHGTRGFEYRIHVTRR